MPGVTNVTGCVGLARGVGWINDAAGADALPRNTSGGGALYGSSAGMKYVPTTCVSIGVGRVGIGGIVEGSVTGTGGCETGARLLLEPGIPAVKVVASSDTDGGG